VNESRSGKREGRAANDPSSELCERTQRDNLTQLGGIVVQCVRYELYYGPAEAQVEECEIFGDRPRQPEQTEARGTKVSRRDRHDEKREGERNCEPKKVEKRVVGDAGTSHAAC